MPIIDGDDIRHLPRHVRLTIGASMALVEAREYAAVLVLAEVAAQLEPD